jgi:RsiW-degrading membrane proteinase PrsW (M82 family)
MDSPPPKHNLRDPGFVNSVTGLLRLFIILASVALLLLIGFPEKLAHNRQWKFLIVISLLSFTLTILAALVTYGGLTHELLENEPDERVIARLAIVNRIFQVAWFSFLIGVASLVALTLRNL